MSRSFRQLFIFFFISGWILSCGSKESGGESTSFSESSEPIAEEARIHSGNFKEIKAQVADRKSMTLIQGGKIRIGSKKGQINESPLFDIVLSDFYLDPHPVTVAQFRDFVEQTEYVSDAERFGDAGVFDFENKTWGLVQGANWKFPQGPDKAPSRDDHPVTQVSWQDAQAYAHWAGKRLPSEFEWEYAARSGENKEEIYSWGKEEQDQDGNYQANVWQGIFPNRNTEADGYLLTAPVGKFAKTPWGLSDMGGNVWEWCQETYNYYPGSQIQYVVDEKIKVQRGGSFLCDQKVCHGYRVSSRGPCSKETSLFHVGFRCAADAPKN
ncbi:MAG: formylglycine-generating enzyme family protein [Bacteroidota bacterium]